MVSTAGRSSVQISHFVKRNSFKFQYPLCGTEDWCKLHCFGDLNAKELVVLCSTYIHPAAEVGDINKFLQSFIDSTTLVGDLNARGELNGQGNRSRAIGGLLDLALSQAMYWPFYSI